jgi:hypothetical protein
VICSWARANGTAQNVLVAKANTEAKTTFFI